MHFTEICACLDHAWLFDIFLSVLGIVRWVCSVPSQMKQIHFFLWLRFLFICIANMRPGAVQVRVWNTVDQWSFLGFVVGQTHLFPLAAFSVYLYHWHVFRCCPSQSVKYCGSVALSRICCGTNPNIHCIWERSGTQTKVTVYWEPRFASSKDQSGLQSRFNFVTFFFLELKGDPSKEAAQALGMGGKTLSSFSVDLSSLFFLI